MNTEVRDFTFYQDPDSRWYVELPEWPGSKADLEMVAGADTMLEYMAEGTGKVKASISEIEIPGFDKLTLQFETPEIGGGYYHLKTHQGIDINLDLWLCDVTKFVFGGYLPKTIYISKH